MTFAAFRKTMATPVELIELTSADVSFLNDNQHGLDLLDGAKSVLRLHRLSMMTLGSRQALSPVLAMLISLFVAESERRCLSVKSLCLAAEMPHASGIRLINDLEKIGLLRRRDDPEDRRVSLVSLTDASRGKVREILRRWAEI